MASQEKKHLESVLKPVLKKAGFRKKGGTWWKHKQDFTQVINIQGSQFSKRFYLNLGVYLQALGKKEWPAEYDCHVRVSTIAESELVHRLLNYEEQLEDEQRKEIGGLIMSAGIPWLEQCSSYEGAKAEYMLPGRIMAGWQREALDEYFS